MLLLGHIIMSSKGKIYLILLIIFSIALLGFGIKNLEDEQTKTLEHINLLTNTNKLLFEYDNNTINTLDSPFNIAFPIISQNDLIINNNNVFKIKEGREVEKINTLDGTIYYYKDNGNYIINSDQSYLKVLSDNLESYYYLIDDHLNYINCRQIIDYKGSILCLNTNLGTIFKLEKSIYATKYDGFNIPEYVINGIFNSNGNYLIIYQSFGSGYQDKSNTILRINDKDVPLTSNFVYQVAFREGNYIISTISESNLNNKINSYEIYTLSLQGDLKNISENSIGVCIY